jgi:hypothetical protein
MDRLRDMTHKKFRAGLLRQDQEGYTQSAQNAATSRNLSSIVVNNYLDRSAEVSPSLEIVKESILPPALDVPDEAPDGERRELREKIKTFIKEPIVAGVSSRSARAQEETTETELEELDQNPKLKIYKARRFYDNAQVVIDVQFLIHVIKILIEHYHITVTKTDMEAIMSYFGEVEIITKNEVAKTREVEPASCCGMKNVTIEKIIQIVKKILVNGVNVAKYFPDFMDFLT